MMELVTWSAAELAERPAAIRDWDRLAADELGDGMDPDVYAAMEARMWHHPLARAGLRVWALVEGEKILATYETYPVIVRIRQGEVIVQRRGAVLGSGFVPPESRGRGLGRRLSTAAVAGAHEKDGIVFAYGTSETSVRVYRDIPHTSGTVRHASWPAAQEGGRGEATGAAPVEPILDLEAWTEPPLVGPYDVRVTPELLSWRLERVAAEFSEDAARPIGARCGRSLVVWVRAGEDGALELLHFRAEAETAGVLLAAARAEARARGLAEVVAWENAANRGWLPEGERVNLEDPLLIARMLPSLEEGGWWSAELGHNL